MKTLLILASLILLTGCQAMKEHSYNMQNDAAYRQQYNTSMQMMSNAVNSGYQMQELNRIEYNRSLQNRNLNCRSYSAGNTIRTNCW